MAREALKKLTAADGDLYGSGVSFLTSRENAPFHAFIGVKIILDFIITDAPNNATFANRRRPSSPLGAALATSLRFLSSAWIESPSSVKI